MYFYARLWPSQALDKVWDGRGKKKRLDVNERGREGGRKSVANTQIAPETEPALWVGGSCMELPAPRHDSITIATRRFELVELLYTVCSPLSQQDNMLVQAALLCAIVHMSGRMYSVTHIHPVPDKHTSLSLPNSW